MNCFVIPDEDACDLNDACNSMCFERMGEAVCACDSFSGQTLSSDSTCQGEVDTKTVDIYYNDDSVMQYKYVIK